MPPSSIDPCAAARELTDPAACSAVDVLGPYDETGAAAVLRKRGWVGSTAAGLSHSVAVLVQLVMRV